MKGRSRRGDSRNGEFGCDSVLPQRGAPPCLYDNAEDLPPANRVAFGMRQLEKASGHPILGCRNGPGAADSCRPSQFYRSCRPSDEPAWHRRFGRVAGDAGADEFRGGGTSCAEFAPRPVRYVARPSASDSGVLESSRRLSCVGTPTIRRLDATGSPDNRCRPILGGQHRVSSDLNMGVSIDLAPLFQPLGYGCLDRSPV